MLSVERALRVILRHVRPLPAESRPVLSARGQALAEDVRAPMPLPPFSNSAMDGYAVAFARGGSLPPSWEAIGAVPAGACFPGRLEPGTAVRIMTGAPVPPGTDAVIPIERVRQAPFPGHILAPGGVEPGENVRFRGEEVESGRIVLRAGARLGPAEIGLLSSLGHRRVKVVRRARIAVFSTGNEVVAAGRSLQPGQIHNSNLPSLVAAVIEAGGIVRKAGHLPDRLDAVQRALRDASVDAVVTSGGVSIGDFDHVKSAISVTGKIYFWKVAIKPGKPFVFGNVGGKFIFGLPGNPVSALLAFEILVKPALQRMAGFSPAGIPPLEARLSRPLFHKPGRREFVRARLSRSGRGLEATPLPWQGSGMLRSLVEADAWIDVPEKAGRLGAGKKVNVLLRPV